jgi:imidazolonepropionase-like amidohydrolase
MLRRPAWLPLVPLAPFLLTGCPQPGKGKTAYVGATLIEGTGAPAVPNAVVLVSEGHIQAVGTADEVSVPRGAEVVHL